MSECKISVIIPTYNRWDNLCLTLKGLALQTVQEGWEVIVGDDGGSDSSREILLRYDYLPSLKYFWHPDKGYRVSLTRNRAAKLVNRESTHLLFIDSDVVLNKHALEHYLELVKTKPLVVICGRYDWLPPMVITEMAIEQHWDDFINARLPPMKVDYFYQANLGPDPRKNPWDCETEHETYAGAALSGNLMVPRDIYEELGGYDEAMVWHGQDCEFGYRLQRVAKAVFCEQVIGYHVNHWRDQQKNLENVRKAIRYIHKKHPGDAGPLTPEMLP